MPRYLLAVMTVIAALSLISASAGSRTRGNVPTLDIAAGCRDVAAMRENRTTNFDRCLKDEQAAREQLQKEWGTYSAALQSQCLHLVTPPALPSYVTLQECLHLHQEAKRMPPETPPLMEQQRPLEAVPAR